MSVTTREALIADLQATLRGSLAPFARGLLSVAPDKSFGVDDLLSQAQRGEIMLYLEGRLGTRPDPRAAFSIWAGWYFRSVIPPLLAANILFDVSPRLSLHGLRFVISADLRAEGIVIPAPLDELPSDQGPTRFAELMDTYLAPLIDHFAERAEITTRVLWSNAGHVFEGVLRMWEPIANERSAFAAARRLLATPRLSNGDRNLLFEPVRYVQGVRTRRVCCMRYLFPDGKTCGPCPLNLRRSRSDDRAS